jgi:hypothetical protein
VHNIKRLMAFIFLSIGIVFLVYSVLALSSLMSSSRAVLMLGSVIQPGGVMSDRATASVFLILLSVAGLGLVGVSVKWIIGSFNNQGGDGNANQK